MTRAVETLDCTSNLKSVVGSSLSAGEFEMSVRIQTCKMYVKAITCHVDTGIERGACDGTGDIRPSSTHLIIEKERSAVLSCPISNPKVNGATQHPRPNAIMPKFISSGSLFSSPP